MFSYTIGFPEWYFQSVVISTKRKGKCCFLKVKETYGHKKRSNALLQPLLTLNLIL